VNNFICQIDTILTKLHSTNPVSPLSISAANSLVINGNDIGDFFIGGKWKGTGNTFFIQWRVFNKII